MTKDETVETLILLSLERMQCVCSVDVVRRACDKCELTRFVKEHFPIHHQLASENKLKREAGRKLTHD